MSQVIYIAAKNKKPTTAEVFFIDNNRNVYLYNIPNKTLTYLFQAVGYADIATINDKIIVGNSAGNGSTEYNFSLNPFSVSENRNWNFGLGNSYCYVSETQLAFGSWASLFRLNLATTPPTQYDQLNIPNNRHFSGDVIYNPTANTFIISVISNTSPYRYFLVECTSPGIYVFNQIKEVEHSYSAVMGLFVYEDILYATNAVYLGNSQYRTDIYKIESGVFTLYDQKNIGVTGASQHPDLNNVRL
jgi:hypothetical protein